MCLCAVSHVTSHLKADKATGTQCAAEYCGVRETEVLEERRRVPSVLLVCVGVPNAHACQYATI
jgi:hypothetical protein